MALNTFFAEQFEQLQGFMVSPVEQLRCMRVDPELKPLLLKALARLDEQPDNLHILVYCDAAFANGEQYFRDLLSRLAEEYRRHADALGDVDARFALANTKPNDRAGDRLVRYFAALSESLPDQVGSLALLLDPTEVADDREWQRAMAFLASRTPSPWAKYLVLDRRVDPRLQPLEGRRASVGTQTFYLPPAEIERRVQDDLRHPERLSAVEQRQYASLLAGFAMARQDYPEAARLQQAAIRRAERDGVPAEAANGWYNLGNTRLAEEDYVAAEACYCKAVELCTDHQLHGLLPLALTNLGLTLHRQRRIDDAIRALKTARDVFRAQNHRPGEAHVLDCLATICHQDGRDDTAEKAWLHALAVYDGISAGDCAEVRQAGRADIVMKLEGFYQNTGRAPRIAELQREVPADAAA